MVDNPTIGQGLPVGLLPDQDMLINTSSVIGSRVARFIDKDISSLLIWFSLPCNMPRPFSKMRIMSTAKIRPIIDKNTANGARMFEGFSSLFPAFNLSLFSRKIKSLCPDNYRCFRTFRRAISTITMSIKGLCAYCTFTFHTSYYNTLMDKSQVRWQEIVAVYGQKEEK
jgi:hypothetical protein